MYYFIFLIPVVFAIGALIFSFLMRHHVNNRKEAVKKAACAGPIGLLGALVCVGLEYDHMPDLNTGLIAVAFAWCIIAGVIFVMNLIGELEG